MVLLPGKEMSRHSRNAEARWREKYISPPCSVLTLGMGNARQKRLSVRPIAKSIALLSALGFAESELKRRSLSRARHIDSIHSRNCRRELNCTSATSHSSFSPLTSTVLEKQRNGFMKVCYKEEMVVIQSGNRTQPVHVICLFFGFLAFVLFL